MALSHDEEVAKADKAPLNSSPERITINSGMNGVSKEEDTKDCVITEPNRFENESSRLNAVTPKPLTVNGNIKSEDHDPDKLNLQTSTDNVSESQSTEPSPFSAPHDEILDQSTVIDAESISTSPDTQILESSSHVASATAITGTIAESSATNIEIQKDSDQVNDDTVNDILDHDSLSKQIDVQQTVDQASGTPMELSDFFNESSDAQIPELDSSKIPDQDLDVSLFSENKDEKIATSQPSAKISRGRESDEDVEPSAKRPRIHDVSKSSEAITSNFNGDKLDRETGASKAGEENTQPNATITAYQAKEIIKILRNISRTNSGKNFRQPVAILWPSIAENYAAKISNPMDLSTIEKKLKEDAYATINDLKADVHLIYNNSVTFNSAENPVSKCAMETRNTLFSKFSSIPPEPVPAPKKEKKTVKRNAPISDLAIRPPPPKRSTRETQAPTQSTAQAFALDPITNTPMIRRDSTKVDGGRPKREIHPPKNKDLSYAVRPKNKKHMLELKFCEEVLSELQKPRYNSISHPFMVPVDPVALGIPNYFAIIKKPMDISTVTKKLKDGAYFNANEFEKDVRQIFLNCYKYNPEGNPVRQMGKSFEEIFNNFWSKKEQFFADNSPVVCPSDRDSEDESEDDEGLDGSSVTASLMSQKERLLEEQSKLITLMGAKHKDEGLLQMQTDLVELIQKRVKAAEEQAKKVLNTKKKVTKSAKKSAPVKKAAPVKKTTTKKKYLGTLEKETISAGLGMIPAQVMATVVDMIKAERPELADAGDETMELDIDSISEGILWQIHAMIMKHVPELEGQIRESMSSEPRQPTRSAKPAPKRKNKPMSKHEQERKIEALTNLDSEFARATFGSQDHSVQGLPNYTSSPQLDINTALEPESSGDEDSDSEEE